MGFFDGQLGNQTVFILKILINAFNIGQKCQFFRVHCFGDGAGRIIRINVVCIKIFVQTNRADDRKEIFFQKVMKNLRIYFRNLSDKTDILTIGIFLFHGQKAAVLSADTNSLDTQLLNHLDKTFIDFI